MLSEEFSSPDTSSGTPSPQSDGMMFQDVFHITDSIPPEWDSPPQQQEIPDHTLISPRYSFSYSPFQMGVGGQDFQFQSTSGNAYTQKRKRSVSATQQSDTKSRIAQQRRRDNRGKFIRNEVAQKLESLYFSPFFPFGRDY